LNTRVSIAAACSLFNSAFGSKVVALVPFTAPMLYAFNTSTSVVSVKGLFTAGIAAPFASASYALTATAANSALVMS